MIYMDANTHRPSEPVKIFLNGREVKEAVTLRALWNGGPGWVEVIVKVEGRFLMNLDRNAVATQPRFGIVRIEWLS